MHLAAQRFTEHAKYGAIDVIDGRREKEQPAAEPAVTLILRRGDDGMGDGLVERGGLKFERFSGQASLHPR